jgi:formylglycine-generating enzyme
MMNNHPSRTNASSPVSSLTSLALVGALALVGMSACGGSHPGGGAGGSGGSGGSAGSDAGSDAKVGSDGGSGSGASGADGGADAISDAAPDLAPPSCAVTGPGTSMCGAAHDSCCTTLLVSGGIYNRTYAVSDGGASSAVDGAVDGASDGASEASFPALRGSDPATVASFDLDKYDVTVGRFRQFVKAMSKADAGIGWLPADGDGKHFHLASGQGLVNVGADAGASHEHGWVGTDNNNIAPTDANLTSCGPTSTWTPTAAGHEDLPINCVNWWEAYAFCIWDGAFLPSEAEWEYAAAGGALELAYPWGATDPGTMNRYAIYDCHYPDGSQACSSAANIAPVGTATLGAGRYGQLDLAGDQSQWNLDFYAPYVPCSNCANLSGGSSRILRGGGFGDPAKNLNPTYRDANGPALRNDFIGIRCARSP